MALCLLELVHHYILLCTSLPGVLYYGDYAASGIKASEYVTELPGRKALNDYILGRYAYPGNGLPGSGCCTWHPLLLHMPMLNFLPLCADSVYWLVCLRSSVDDQLTIVLVSTSGKGVMVYLFAQALAKHGEVASRLLMLSN
jgi:hypothetical protein